MVSNLVYFSGSLAEKALAAVVPQNFPFTIRLTSQVMMSNGKKQDELFISKKLWLENIMKHSLHESGYF
jgi:hypothetical protein